jgi:hypothetical protein
MNNDTISEAGRQKFVCFRLVLLSFIFCCVSNVLAIAASDAEPIDGGPSPNGQYQVVKVWGPMNDGGNQDIVPHFELRNKSGKTLISELSIAQLQPPFGFLGAFQVLWRSDSRFVAIATETSKYTIHTLVFFKTGQTFKRIDIPDYDDDDEGNWRSEDGVHQLPYAWRKNGDLVLDITYGYTKIATEDEISEYFATVHFSGNPPKGSKGPQSKVAPDDQK